MAINTQNAFIGTPPIDGGVFFRAPLGTQLPKEANDELHRGFEDHGAVGADGFNVSPERSETDINAFGGDVFASAQESYAENFTVTLLEDDREAVAKTVFGDANVKVTPATETEGKKTRVLHTSTPLPMSAFVLKAVSGEKSKTYVIERGKITTVAEVTTVHNNVTSYQITGRAFKGSDPESNYANVIELRDDATPAAPSDDPEEARGLPNEENFPGEGTTPSEPVGDDTSSPETGTDE